MKRIILIDDDRDDAELFGEALETVNPALEFQHFENASEAKDALEKLTELPDIIFLDINLPLMSGWEMLTNLKKHDRLSAIPVMMYSTSSQSREKEIAHDLGAEGFITKPNDYKELISLLEDILNNRQPIN